MAISKQLYANNAKTTIASTVSSPDTTITVADGSLFPTPSSGQYFLVTMEYSGVYEIVKVQGRSGNSFLSCVRGQEGLTAQGFPVGARIECRVTSGTLSAFARGIDKVDELGSVDLLSSPNNSNSNSYICHSNDDSGNPVLALVNAGNKWRFSTYTVVTVAGTIATVNSFGLTSTDIANNLSGLTTGEYVLQFVTGVNIGLCRSINATSNNTVSWTTPLAVIPSAGDQFEIYKSDCSTIKTLVALANSPTPDATKANLAGGNTFTGTQVFSNIAKFVNQVDIKSSITANTSTTTLDLSTAEVFKLTISANTAIVLTNPPSGTDVFSFTIITVNDSTSGRALSLPGNSKYAGGILPPRTTTANAIDWWTVSTDDAGTTYTWSLAIADAK